MTDRPRESQPGGDRPGDDLAGLVVLVTGGGRGIGRAIVEGLTRRRAAVAFCARSADQVSEVAKAVTAAGGLCLGLPGDVTDPDDVDRVVRTAVDRLGPIDVVVCNAGAIDPEETDPWSADIEAWWHVVEVNLLGTQRVLQAVVPSMVDRGRGRVVGLTSGMAVRDVPDYSAYSVSKTALLRLSGTYAEAGRAHGVTVFDVAPGVVRTDMTAGMPVMADRSEWSDPALAVDLVAAVASGKLDELSGRYLRAGVDDPAALRDGLGERLVADPRARRLVLHPYGSDDPLG